MSVSPARAAAFDILLRVERDNSYANELLHSGSHENLSTADHALSTDLVMGILRWRSTLDDEISRASSQPLAKLDLEVLIALRLALYQFRHLDRVPQRAALHESVELVKRARKRSAAPFANAVLRKLSASPKDTPVPGDLSAKDIAATLAHPLWLVERWAREYGVSTARQICQHNQLTPTTSIRLRDPDAENAVAPAGIALQSGSILSSARLVRTGDITKTQAFRDRSVVIQDDASQLVATLVGPAKEGSRILDCCAAPGGKTLAVADRNPNAVVIAVELHPHRARLLQRLVAAGSQSHIQIVAADATRIPLSRPFDYILADVPCSGTGTLARNPEIKWRLTADDLAELHHRQVAILNSTLAHLAPGGRLIYSTCSLEKEENEDVVEEVLRETKSFRTRDCREELDRLKKSGELTLPDPSTLTHGPYLRTIPGVHPCDGFFAAILERS